jgi:hypothetical protein
MIIGNPITLGGGGGGYEIPQYAVSFVGAGDFTVKIYNNAGKWDGVVEYSLDGKTWSVWNGTQVSSRNGFIAFRGTGNTKFTGGDFFGSFNITGTNVMCTGNIENLLDWQTVQAGNHPTMADYCFNALFYSSFSVLLTPPSLGAVTLTKGCYANMFAGCTKLVEAPVLPALTLAEECYKNMFYNCRFASVPALPATTMAPNCYQEMFMNCSSITIAPSLSAAATLAEGCFSEMFSGCTSLKRIPKLPVTTLADYCYSYMFENCTNVKISTTNSSPYTKAYRIPVSGTGVDATDALTDMFAGTGGTFVGTPTINTTYYTNNNPVT